MYTCDDWYTNDDFCCFDCLLTVFDCFDEWYIVPIVKNTQNHWCTNRHRSTKTVPIVYQQCTNRLKQSKDSQNSKNDHWCTNHHRSTGSVTTVYQSLKQSRTVKNSQKTVKTAKMNIGVPIVTVYQDCTNSVTIVYQS